MAISISMHRFCNDIYMERGAVLDSIYIYIHMRFIHIHIHIHIHIDIRTYRYIILNIVLHAGMSTVLTVLICIYVYCIYVYRVGTKYIPSNKEYDGN